MGTLKDESLAYEPKAIKNIVELEAVSIDFEVYEETKINDEGKEYINKYIDINGEKYRVPASVLAEIKEILTVKPDFKTFKVTKTGEGLKTKYKVIQLD